MGPRADFGALKDKSLASTGIRTLNGPVPSYAHSALISPENLPTNTSQGRIQRLAGDRLGQEVADITKRVTSMGQVEYKQRIALQ